ncbi:uncharacterized protein LAJ45_05983 [Morchella importuna]|uniref:uncharacterized protein n=1 Tax=Morchella importuna TaxID=1174673 RepID=UPI001E8D02CB|nr:uncharacterized protein LAJ45_05983 [Morchella importuna]KAH8149831.1 hypothetical protein LAJ45_05983 [Morchella importuna]
MLGLQPINSKRSAPGPGPIQFISRGGRKAGLFWVNPRVTTPRDAWCSQRGIFGCPMIQTAPRTVGRALSTLLFPPISRVSACTIKAWIPDFSAAKQERKQKDKKDVWRHHVLSLYLDRVYSIPVKVVHPLKYGAPIFSKS